MGTLPKSIMLDSKHTLKPNTLGIRIPDDPIIRYLQDELLYGTPLLISSLYQQGSSDNGRYQEQKLLNCELETSSWCNEVDFIIDADSRPYDASTIYDMTTMAYKKGEPELIQEGVGEYELA